MAGLIDDASSVREGEELDAQKLEAYLVDNVPGAAGPIHIEQFAKGHSNLTYLVRMGNTDYVLRRPPFGSKVKSAHDMSREFRVLSKLSPVYPPAPQPVLFCDDQDVMGADFYLMERKHGVVLRREKPEGLDLGPGQVRNISNGLIDNLAKLHLIDWEGIGLGELRKEGQFMERQVNGWIKRYGGSQTDDIPAMNQLGEWLTKGIPADSGAALIHNDYKFDNVMLNPDDLSQIVGVLDWEMATIGDPLADLGTAIGYWAEPQDDAIGTTQCFLTLMPGAPTRREFVDRYAEKTGTDCSNIHYYYVFALYKLGVILQQIYYRYHQGLTKDERFAMLIHLVRMIADMGTHAVETEKI